MRPVQLIPEETVREQLRRVLLSPEFRSSKRSQDFLQYVVDRALSGETEQLKERTIGIDVLGRPPSYDPSEDAAVRVKASEVRKRLGLYYAGEGARDAIRIELPPGTYVPEFRYSPAGAAANSHDHDPVAETPRHRTRPVWIAAGCLMVLALSGGAYRWIGTRPLSPLSEFWKPVVQGSAPISICVAFVPVYSLEPDPASGRKPAPQHFVQLTDQFVGGGDLVAVSRLSTLLTRMERPFLVKVGDSVSFEDLRTSPAILVGYSYTHWKQISQTMRYVIDVSRPQPGITDGGAPTKWMLSALPAGHHPTEDYAIVTRVFHPDTHAMLVELAGITQYGTDAAADFVTNADLLSEGLRDASAGWRQRNLQFVLHVKVISGTPSAPKVVTRYIW